MIYRNTLTGERLPVKTFPTCENGCPCDEYKPTGDGRLFCPYCKVICEGTTKHVAPPNPYDVDGDGWYFRPIRQDENPRVIGRRVSARYGFVSEDGKRLYLRSIESDPNPAVPFESLGFPKFEELFHGDPE